MEFFIDHVEKDNYGGRPLLFHSNFLIYIYIYITHDLFFFWEMDRDQFVGPEH